MAEVELQSMHVALCHGVQEGDIHADAAHDGLSQVVWIARHRHIGDAFFDADAAQFLREQLQCSRGEQVRCCAHVCSVVGTTLVCGMCQSLLRSHRVRSYHHGHSLLDFSVSSRLWYMQEGRDDAWDGVVEAAAGTTSPPAFNSAAQGLSPQKRIEDSCQGVSKLCEEACRCLGDKGSCGA